MAASAQQTKVVGGWIEVVAFARAANGDIVGADVSVPTLLTDWVNISERVESVQITLLNLDPTNEGNLLVDFTEDGTHPDADTTGGVAPPLHSVTVTFSPESSLQSTFRLTAGSDSPSFPVISVAWQVLARLRH